MRMVYLKTLLNFIFWNFYSVAEQCFDSCPRQLFKNKNIPSTYFSRMSFLKIKGQNFEAASWPQLISSNFKDHTKRLTKIRSSHSEMGHIQNCPQPKELDPWLKGFPDKRLFLLRCTSFLSFLKGEDTVIINQCPNYPVIMN